MKQQSVFRDQSKASVMPQRNPKLVVILSFVFAGCTTAMNGTSVTTPPEVHPTYVMEGSDLYRVMVEESVTHHWLFGEQKTSRIVEKTKIEPGTAHLDEDTPDAAPEPAIDDLHHPHLNIDRPAPMANDN